MDATVSDFLATGIKDLLEADARPTVVFQRCPLGQRQTTTQPLYINPAFRILTDQSPEFFGYHSATTHTEAYSSFLQWATGRSRKSLANPNAATDTYQYARLEWQRLEIRECWNVITPVNPVHKEPPTKNKIAIRSHQPEPSHKSSITTTSPARGVDWTVSPPPTQMSDHVKLIRSIDWSSTSAGEMNSWPFQLRTMLNIIMADPEPATIFWGPEFLMFYNEAYSHIAGSKHPKLMGLSPAVGWSEAWPHFVPIFERGWERAQITKEEDVLLFLERNGFPEEVYVTLTFIPMVGEQGEITGLYQHISETTRQVLSSRRMNILLELSQLGAAASSTKQFCEVLLKAVEPFGIDIPFAAVYLVDHEATQSEAFRFQFKGAVGLPDGMLDTTLDVHEPHQGLAWMFREAQAAGGRITVGDRDSHWPRALLEHKNPDRGFGDTCNQISVHLLRPSTTATTRGFLIVGSNRRQVDDHDHQEFIHLLGRQVNASLASVVLLEDEQRENLRRAEEVARDMDIIENRFYRVAQLSPVGIYVLNRDGSLVYCNDKWYEYTGVTKGDVNETPWMENVWPEDLELVQSQWARLVQDGEPVNFDFRYKKAVKHLREKELGLQEEIPFQWFLASAYPDMSDDGVFLSISGTLTEITSQKQAEVESERKASVALESKRQQENFLDMTSHELRNPLNSILMCADQVAKTLKGLRAQAEQNYKTNENAHISKRPRMQTPQTDQIDESIEAAEIIIHCAEHQRRIADDILTLSKLDADLLTISPIPVQPLKLVHHALKLFQLQAQSAHVKLELEVDQSLSHLNVDWVQLDESRVLQIIINLASNAIKFTSSEGRGSVTIGLAASLEEPIGDVSGIRYIPPRSPPDATNNSVEANSNDQIFLSFFIQDTGKGLTEDEQKKLFNRFVQAAPRTYAQYGGSGLGLYISRQLTELQGGRIGLASKPRNGSLFSFYIKTARSHAPEVLTTASAIQLERLMSANEPSLQFDDWLRNASILVVEDNLVNQKVLKQQLSSLVREVHVAGNGVDALHFIQTTVHWAANQGVGNDLNVVFLDVNMPVMDGLTCIREIRRLQKEGQIRSHLPVVAITANARQEQIIIAKEAGMDEVVTKPFRIQDLKNVLEQVTRAARSAASEQPE